MKRNKRLKLKQAAICPFMLILGVSMIIKSK